MIPSEISPIEEVPFFYLKLMLLPETLKTSYGKGVEYRAEIRIPDKYQSSSKIVLYVDANLNLVGDSVRLINSRYPLVFDLITQYDKYHSNIVEVLDKLRKLHEVRCGAPSKPTYLKF